MSKNTNSLYTSQDNEVLSTYLKSIEKIPLLSYEEEYDLALKAKSGDKKAREKIANANLRFVVSVAKKYRGQGLALEDLINEGNIGLLTAIDKYEPEKGYHFISYAVWWIRQSILKALAAENNEYGIILRAKGMLPSPDGTWIYFDMVPEEYEIREGQPEYTGRLCVIGSKIDEAKLEKLFMLS